jgi:formamidopyrimidine-DNA glycosylase
MPEGPEVEVVRQQILSKALIGFNLTDLKISSKNLRKSLKSSDIAKLKDCKFLNLERKGKYLFFQFDNFFLMNHLGMTGKWRVESNSSLVVQSHDHYFFSFDNKKILVFNDVRRFGMMSLINKSRYLDLKKQLGWDPITDDLSDDLLVEIPDSARTSKKSIKSILMDQRFFCGVGNIYASEILFLSKIHPCTTAANLKKPQWQTIATVSKKILCKAVTKGGSTIQSYQNVNGQSGKFQELHFVYGREDLNCKICKSNIKKITLQQRSTFFCTKCQKKY